MWLSARCLTVSRLTVSLGNGVQTAKPRDSRNELRYELTHGNAMNSTPSPARLASNKRASRGVEMGNGIRRAALKSILRQMHQAEAGAVFVEYVIVLVLVSAAGVAGIIPLGVALSHYFKAQQSVLTLPFP
jgi:Flp pilus assembly pilin Flp